jgi:anthranilate synthase/aminodeoxychorismate synthase-like glutamine amidotransferase
VRVLLVDNFDSFTHNLAQVLGGLGGDVVVRRHDVPVVELLATNPDRVVISPGPGTPDRTGSCSALLDALAPGVAVLGVCLGMQLLAMRDGVPVIRAPRPVHGKASLVRHDGQGLFEGLPAAVRVGRYHSLCVDAAAGPSPDWVTSAWTEDGIVMGMRHVRLPWEGVQFHPESVLTPEGPRMLANFLEGRGLRVPRLRSAR